MATLVNNGEQVIVKGGTYLFKASGALDIQVQLDGEGFATVPGGSLSGVDTGTEIDLATDCTIKIINAGANTLTFSQIR